MKNPYAQVAMTYVRRPFSTAQSWLMLFAVAVSLSSAINLYLRSSYSGIVCFLYPLGCLLVLLAVHFKEQFCTPLAQALPGYRRVHIVVAVCYIFLVAIVLPMLLASMTSISLFAFPAVVFFCFSLFVFGNSFHPILMVIFLVAGSLALIVPEYEKHLKFLMMEGQLPWVAAGFFAVGGAVLVHCFLRFLHMNEDSPEYYYQWGQKTWAVNTWKSSSLSLKKSSILPQGGRLEDRRMVGCIRHVRQASISWWSRVCRWPLGMESWWTLAFWAVAAQLYIWIIEYVFSLDSPIIIVSMLILLAGMKPLGQLQQRIQMMEYEASLPIDRVSYLWEVCLTTFMSWFQLWIVLAVVLGFGEIATRGDAGNWFLVFMALPVTGCFQILMFGFTIWTARFRSKMIMNLPVILVAMIGGGMMPFVQALGNKGLLEGPYAPVLGTVVGMAFLGIVAAWDGYRRWLKADLA